jgi:hypothetical protein
VAKIIGEKAKRKLITLYDSDIESIELIMKVCGANFSEAVRIAVNGVATLQREANKERELRGKKN